MEPRPWYRLHRKTHLAMAAIAAVFLALNFTPRRRAFESYTIVEYGFPHPVTWSTRVKTSANDYGFIFRSRASGVAAGVLNVLWMAGSLALAAAAVEWIARNRDLLQKAKDAR